MTKCMHQTLRIILKYGLGSCLVFFISGAAKNDRPDKNVKETQKKTLEKRQPKKNIRILTFKDKKNAQEIRAKTIRSIRELLDGTKDQSKRYELLRRYGEMYAEQAEYALEKEMIVYDQQYVAWERRKKGDAPKLDNTNSTLSLKKAVDIYKEIVSKYNNYPGVDITYYELGKNLLRLGDKSGIDYLLRLIKEKPRSQYIPEALFALGEHYFDSHDMVSAKKYYNEAAKYRDHAIYPYAVYKLGWTHYNFPATNPQEEKEKFKKAIIAFKLVVKLASGMKDEEDRAIYLRQEAINDLIMVWAETEDVDSAWAYFKQIGDHESFYKMLERLGEIYVDQGKNADAIRVYSRILAEVPKRESNATNHAKLMQIFVDSNKFAQVVKNASLMTKLYLKGGTWYKANRKNSELIADAEATVELTIHKFATYYHKEGQKRKYPDMFKIAARLYLVYLDTFPKNEKSYELRFFLADTLFELKKFDAAASQYFLVVQTNEKDGKYLHDAALNAVIAMNNVVNAKKFPALPPSGKAKKEVKIPPEKLKLQTALDLYVRLFSTKEEAKAMAVTAAKIEFDHGHYPAAVKRFEKVAMQFPATKQSDESVKAILGFYKDKRDWDETIRYCKLFLDAKGVLINPLRNETHKLLVFASFERALDFEKAKKPIEAAEAFLQFQKDFPQEKNASLALYNSMVIYFKNGLVNKALDSAKLVLQSYPKFEKKDDVVMTVAETYEGLGEFQNAAYFFAVFAQQWPKDKRSPDSLYASGVLSKGAKDFAKSAGYLEAYIAQYPSHKFQLSAHLELAEVYESLKRIPDAMRTYQTIASRFKNAPDDQAFASTKLAVLKLPADRSKADLKEIWALHKWLVRKGSPAAVQARKLVATELFESTNSAQKAFIDGPVDSKNLEKSLQAKQAELVRLAQVYQAIIALGYGDYVVAATYRLGEAHEAFSEAIAKTKMPEGLDAKVQAELAKGLAEISDRLKNEAGGFYKNAYESTISRSVFTNWGVKAYERLALIDSKRYQPIHEFIVEPGYAAHALEYDQSVATALH